MTSRAISLRSDRRRREQTLSSRCSMQPGVKIPSALSIEVQLTLLLAFANTEAVSLWRLGGGGARGAGRVEPSEEPEGLALTARERTILDAVAKGMTTAAISKELWVSEHTVKFHLTNIYRELEVPNRAGAVRYALEHRLIAA